MAHAPDKITHKIFSYDFALILERGGKNGEDFQSERPWNVYSNGQALVLSKGDTLIEKAKRIGYEESTVTQVEGDN